MESEGLSDRSAKSEFDGSIKIFAMLIGVALVIKVIIQLIQSNKPMDPTVPTVDNPTGTNTSKINGQADAIIATYGWSLFWIICFWVTVVSVLTRRFVTNRLEASKDQISVLFYSAPFIFVIVLVIWNIVQTHTFSKKINTNQVPSTYLGFSIASTFFLGLTIGLLFILATKLLACKNEDIKILIMIAWIAITCSIITGGMIAWTEVLLTSFTTDG